VYYSISIEYLYVCASGSTPFTPFLFQFFYPSRAILIPILLPLARHFNSNSSTPRAPFQFQFFYPSRAVLIPILPFSAVRPATRLSHPVTGHDGQLICQEELPKSGALRGDGERCDKVILARLQCVNQESGDLTQAKSRNLKSVCRAFVFEA